MEEWEIPSASVGLTIITASEDLDMPWSPSSASKHDKDVKSAKQKRQWAHIANASLRRGDSESVAIRKASGSVGRKRSGGKVR